MYLSLIIPILSGIKKWSNIAYLNSTLKPFLSINDSITFVEDDLYKFFNNNMVNITISSNDNENILTIQLYNHKENVLPECLGRLINVHTLFLQNNKLTKLPDYFKKFTSLKLLDLSSNSFNKLPEVIFSLRTLISLHLNNNLLVCIDDNIGKLEKLEILDVSKNDIKKISTNLKKLTNLNFVNLSYNRNIIRDRDGNKNLKKDVNFWNIIPSSVESLYLNNIRLKHIPEDFNFPKLSRLAIQNNLLKYLPQSFRRCSDMSRLDASFNHLTSIPYFVSHWKKLQYLKLKENKITSFVCFQRHLLPVLEELDLSWNNISSFEVEGYNIIRYCDINRRFIRQHPSITSLEPSSTEIDMNYSNSGIINSLKILSITITTAFIVPNLLIFPNLVNIKIFNLDNKTINPKIVRSLFYDLQQIETLENLELSKFNLIIIPKEIFTLRHLKVLSLKSCKLREIPDKIITLTDLETIDLYDNDIKNINPKIFEFDTPITIRLSRNPFKYLPSKINNANSNFKLEVTFVNLSFFKKDEDNLGLMDISYKKIFQMTASDDCFDNLLMSIERLYKKANEEEYIWRLNKMLKIKNKEVKESTKNYRIIMEHWEVLENYITDSKIKNKFYSYLKAIWNDKIERDGQTTKLIENIKGNIKNYIDAIFEILIDLISIGNTEIIEPIIITIEPGLSVCLDGQLQHFSYVYHSLIGDYSESNSVEYFINNRIAKSKYNALREITTSNTEQQNVHIFLYWQGILSEILGLPLFHQEYRMNTNNIFLQSEEYVLYQFFKLMSVKNVVKDLYESINETNRTITMTSEYIYHRNSENLKEYLNYEGDIEDLKIIGITEKGIYFILEEMNLIKRAKKTES